MKAPTIDVSIYEIEDVRAAIIALNALEEKTSVRVSGHLLVVGYTDSGVDLVIPVRWDDNDNSYVIEWRL